MSTTKELCLWERGGRRRPHIPTSLTYIPFQIRVAEAAVWRGRFKRDAGRRCFSHFATSSPALVDGFPSSHLCLCTHLFAHLLQKWGRAIRHGHDSLTASIRTAFRRRVYPSAIFMFTPALDKTIPACGIVLTTPHHLVKLNWNKTHSDKYSKHQVCICFIVNLMKPADSRCMVTSSPEASFCSGTR